MCFFLLNKILSINVMHVTVAKKHNGGTSTNASTLSPSANSLTQPPYLKSFLILFCVINACKDCTWIDLVNFQIFRNFSTMYMSPCRITLTKIYLHFVSSITKAVLLNIKKSFSCIPSFFWLVLYITLRMLINMKKINT